MKRRRASSAASRGQDDEYLEESTPEPSPAPSTTRKRKKLDPSELCQQLYDSVRNYKKEDGTPLCDAFIRAPKRRQEPGYYEVVSNPIDLLKVQQKLKTDSYEDVEELASDLELLVNNARAFYAADSEEHKDANSLWELFQTQKTRILESEEKCKTVLRVGRQPRRSAVDTDDASETSTGPEEDYSQFEDLFTAVMTATDAENNNRPLHTVFQILPSKKRYPEYYEVIENPIDLRMIATKIQSNSYQTLNDMEKDLLTMTRNACLFNEPGSQIYKDAKALKKVITSKKIEVEHSKTPTTGKTSERIRNKRFRGNQSLSAITAALTEEDLDSDEEEDASGHTDGGDTPQWQIFDMLRNAVNTSGVPLTEAFWKLPSRKYYPDYYKQIKSPISLNHIHARLRRGEYGTVSKMCADLNLLFENAKKYNVHTSKIYKDASKMQKMVIAKRQELNEMEESESDCDSTDSRSLASFKRRSSKVRTPVVPSTVPSPLLNTTPLSGRRYRDNPLLKKKLLALQKCLVEYTGEDGRQPMMVFMEKPSKKLYPDYYQIIQQPIDMQTIDNNIKCEKYATVDDMVGDLRMMFNNCRRYNEEGSVIYEDANTLERALNDKLKELSQPERNEKRTPNKSHIFKEVFLKSGRPRSKLLNPLESKLRTLYEAIRDYREPKANRQLALVFMKLPSKSDYPDYYDIIKQPIDMERIAQKLKISSYESVEELASEFLLMFDNACKYNEPDSQIYKDALELQRVCLQTKHSISEEPQSVPDVVQAVQGILVSLFTSTYTCQDEEGRCYSDSLTELPEYDDIDGQKVRGISLDLIKRRLDRGLYKRLDSFQEDVFSCFERARKLSRTDSQAFEDSVELQSYFIRQRDELCRNGAVLSSPALQYTLAQLSASVECIRSEASTQEESLGGGETDDSEAVAPVAVSKGESMTCNQQVYRVGEFVYMEPDEKGVDPRIIYIERLWTNSEQQQMLYGNCFFRPHETFHVATRRFLEQEVFKSDVHIAVPLSQLQGKCYIMSVKEYFKNKPEGFADKDVYVCECRYSTKLRAFKKIKIWNCQNDTAVIIPRETPLEPRRVMSIFKERVEKHKGELAELQLQEKLVEKEKPNVLAINVVGEEGNTYYEQYNTICSGVVKTGDFVYVAGDGGRQLIAQIQAIWETKDGKCYFRGPWLVPPPEVPHAQSRLFYPQEVFLSTLHDCSPLVGIVGKCAVMELKDYVTSRLTEVPESDVYVVESIYDEVKRQIRKLTVPGLRKFIHSSAVTPDEIYYFPKTICPPKIGAGEIAVLHAEVIKAQPSGNMDMQCVSAIPSRLGDADLMQDDSLDAPASVTSGDPPTPSATPIPMQPTPISIKKAKTGKKLVTGYILYSSEVRKTIVSANPESTFGEISRIVGNEWRSLPTPEKQAWEEKADRCNKETAARLALENENCPSPGQPQNENARTNVFECCWDKCDFQFEDLSDCSEHCLADATGHIPLHFANIPQGEAEFHCQWRGCIRVKKQAPPFPHLQRLQRHVREVHINKGNGRFVAVHDRSRNYVPSRRIAISQQQQQLQPQMVAAPTVVPVFTSTNKISSTVPLTAAVQQKQLEPIFVSVPPRPQRVLHSDAYIKYIEGLQADSRSISNWEKTLKATQQTQPPPDESRLPAHWLANGQGAHGSVLNALWALRDHMFRDALSIHRQL